ncbi:MAG TPA: DNA-binding domain-containing protein [Casimicrobiaceae bacterium]|nr:DNA-binding domain-containing protein [Casimicrobiaceae bacterium]
MQSLRELQRAFCAATLFGDTTALASLELVGGSLQAGARIEVYRNNILGNYRKALAATYPVVRRLVGESFFSAAVEHFVLGHPSTRGDVNRYGGEFAMFLASYAPARDLAYLPDVARLEWAIDQANIAADAAPIDVDALAGVPIAAQGSLRFTLHPSVRLVVSAYPILRIWRVNQPDSVGEDRVDLGEGGDALLVRRGSGGVSIERLGEGERALLAALAANTTLADATAGATEAEPGFDLAAALRRHVAGQTIVGFLAPPPARGKRT